MNNRRNRCWTTWVVAMGLVASCSSNLVKGDQDVEVNGPLSPEDSIDKMRLAPGLQIELVASEPQIVDPVAMRFDGRGRLWVVEMRDYPHGPAEGEKPKSRIKILEDRDSDGHFEIANVFADKLLFVTGLQPWKDGVIVTMAGQVAYMKDTTGDGRADQFETWYTGFAEQNSQLRANHPRLGLDNQVYIANGLRGGSVVDARRPDAKPLSLSGKDFRFDPTTFEYETLTGVGQFGLTFDDSGNRFVCSNRNPLKQIVLEERYIRRNPAFAPPAAAYDVATAGADSRIYPISRAWTTSNLHAGQFTAACGVLIFRGNALPGHFYGNGFTCDPTGNLVHREVLKPVGASFQSNPGRNGVEFLASPDDWFRPVNLSNGPDGSLYIVDMYRAVIEHPQFMPDELKNRPDLLDGVDRGRIYRVTAVESTDQSHSWPMLEDKPGRTLVSLLEHPNAWQRETAARLLFERQDKSVSEQLRQVVIDGPTEESRVQALWCLEGLDSLDDSLLVLALGDDSAMVRQQAVAVAGLRLESKPELRRQLAILTGDRSAKVRFQVALELAPVQESEIDGLREIAIRGCEDTWTRRAVMIAAGPRAAGLAVSILENPPWSNRTASADETALIRELVALAAANPDNAERIAVLRAIGSLARDDSVVDLQRSCLVAFGQALRRNRQSISGLLQEADDSGLMTAIEERFADARRLSADADIPDAIRAESVDLLVFDKNAEPLLKQLALRSGPQRVRIRALTALSQRGGDDAWPSLLDAFASESPPIRRAMIDAMLARTSRAKLLLDTIDSGKVKASELDQSHANRLLKHRDNAVRARASKLLADSVPEDRKKVLADYQTVLKIDADAQRGSAVFKKNCAQCHRVGDLGVNVAPDISDSRTKKREQILADILQPNRAIDSNYVSYSLVTTNGLQLTGIIASETATSITLRQQEGKERTLLRSEIDELRSSGVSLMPEGLEKSVPKQEMADLILFLKNWRYLDGRTPLGKID